MTDTLTAVPPDGLKDFSRARKRIRFRIDGDVFEAAPALPAETLVEFSNRFADVTEKKLGAGELFSAIRGVLELVLLPESFARLSVRLRDPSSPVDMEQMSDTVVWLVEQYGLRPTQQPSSSHSGPVRPEPGTGLTASTPDAASTSALFLSTGS